MLRILIYVLALPLALTTAVRAQSIEWLSWEEAMERQQTEPRKVLIDVYTDWCGWCKQMDKKVFVKEAVTDHIRENFYAVKLNAEQREDILFDGHTFTYDATAGRRGVHSLAVALLDGRMSYPSVVYLDEENKRITISPGFKPAKDYLRELTYISGEHYRTVDYASFVENHGR